MKTLLALAAAALLAGCGTLRPVGLGPCLPATDDGAPQACGWPVLGPGGHVRDACKVLVSPDLRKAWHCEESVCDAPECAGTEKRAVVAPGRESAAYAGALATPPSPADQPRPTLTPADCEEQRHGDGSQMSPRECYEILGLPVPPPARPQTFPELLLWLRSRQTFAAVEQGGQW